MWWAELIAWINIFASVKTAVDLKFKVKPDLQADHKGLNQKIFKVYLYSTE